MGFEHCVSALERVGILFRPGLTLQEICRIEERYAFRFPPDYCAFLMHALPVSHGFVDWRHADEATILDALSSPYEAICFDIECSHFWLDAWGPRPIPLSDAFAIAKRALDQAPTLIPVHKHRYIPDAPEEVGNPIFAVWQTDIVCSGRDLAEYLEREFAFRAPGGRRRVVEPMKHISFWSDLPKRADVVPDHQSDTGRG